MQLSILRCSSNFLRMEALRPRIFLPLHLQAAAKIKPAPNLRISMLGASTRGFKCLSCSFQEISRNPGCSDRVLDENKIKRSISVSRDEEQGKMQRRSSSDAVERLDEIDRKVERLAMKLARLASVSEVQMKINSINLGYVPFKIGRARRDRRFRASLLEAYGYKKLTPGSSSMLRCPILDLPVPSSSLIAAHIFKHEWSGIARETMGLDSIDDCRNGMLLFSPIEASFDKLQLCFVYDEEDRVVCHVLDPALQSQSLLCTARRRNPFLWKEQHKVGEDDDDDWESLTFENAVDGKSVSFMTHHRPLREALNFHARQARAYAIAKGWMGEQDWDFEDFYTDEQRWRQLRIWLDRKVQ